MIHLKFQIADLKKNALIHSIHVNVQGQIFYNSDLM